MRLQTSGVVGALLGLLGGGIAAGTDAMTVDCWPDAAAVQPGRAAPSMLQAAGRVSALLGLPGGGIAAGTDADTAGIVELWLDAAAAQP